MEFSSNVFGRLSSAPDGAISESIYSFISDVLNDFKSDKVENENTLTNRLCQILGYKKPDAFPFFFQHQNLEDSVKNTSTDFAVLGTYAYAQSINHSGYYLPILKFEAKRLSSKLPKNREREYVIGEYRGGTIFKNSGAIERFKNERHGVDIAQAGIIGYIQTDTASVWISKINSWIADEISKSHDPSISWDMGDKLSNELTVGKVKSHTSTHSRKTSKPIHIRHFWVDLSVD